MDTENRQNPRHYSLNTVAYCCLDDAGQVTHQGMGRTLNLSEDGILIHLYRNIGDCRELLLHIGLHDQVIETRGVVVHCCNDRFTGYRCGIKFVDLGERSRQSLREFAARFTFKKSTKVP